MPDAELLTLTVQSYTKSQLAVKVKNTSGVVLNEPMTMQITVPKGLLDSRIRAAADAACGGSGASTLDTIVTGMEGKFSVWAVPSIADNVVTIMFLNDKDKMGADIDPAMTFAAGADFTVLIPLDPQAQHTNVKLPYSYFDDTHPRVDGKLELQAVQIDWTPNVILKSNQDNPTMITPMTQVKISWSIENAVTAELSGPLPGGNASWSLPITSPVSSGSFQIRAAGPMTYTLRAQVRGPEGLPNVWVDRILALDVDRGNKYAYAASSPERVLPYTRVQIDWAVWGVQAVSIEGNGGGERFELTERSSFDTYQGAGFWPTTAPKATEETDVRVDVTVQLPKKRPRVEASTTFKVIPWRTMQAPDVTGRPIGLAVSAAKIGDAPAAPRIALLTTDGLWTAPVGETDSAGGPDTLAGGKLDFSKSTTIAAPKAWLALAALDHKFVALRQTSQDTLQVALYSAAGQPDEILPLDLPSYVRPLLGRSDTVFDLAVFKNTVYVVVEGSLEGGPVRCAFSVSFDPVTNQGTQRAELLLEHWHGYRLLTFDNALYALSRNTGEMIRFDLSEGKLEAYTAATAVTNGASMVKRGLLVPIGRILAVLGPSSVPPLTVGLRNVLKAKSLTPLKATGPIPQDLVYSPIGDSWVRCGHGLDAVAGVVAFRGGRSPRLWFIDPNKNTWTLTVRSEELFLPDYKETDKSEELPSIYNKKRELGFVNNTGVEFVPMNETCLKAGLRPFSATGLMHLNSPMPKGPHEVKIAEWLEFRYSDASPSVTATLRFLAKRGPGAKHDYVLEVSFSGPAFSYTTACFKQLTVNAQGGVSVVEVPGKLQGYLSSGLIERLPWQLGTGIRLRVGNGTPYSLWFRSPESTVAADHERRYLGEPIKIRYDTAPFSLYAHGAGELPFDVDFALPPGIEISPSREAQKKRIRIRWDGPQIFEIENPSINETSQYDTYEFTLRYKVVKILRGAYLGDGAATDDLTSIYVPLAEPPNATNAKILKLDANNLDTKAQASVTGRNLFLGPNSVTVLEDRILGAFNREQVAVFDYDLRSKPGLPVAKFDYDILTNCNGFGPYVFTVGMKDSSGTPRYGYRLDSWFFLDEAREHLHHYTIGALPFNKGFGPGRVPGAPPWVALNAICPMHAMAVSVEGGIIGFDRKNNWRPIDVALPGTGRAEAIHVDPIEHLIFSAHSKASGTGLMISRVNLEQPGDKLTIELPGAPYHMVMDPHPPTTPNLEYNRARNVSVVATSDALFVSLARKIFVLDKTMLTQRQNIELHLPVRLIAARRGKPAGETHPTYSVAHGYYFVWAIGSRYLGDGQTVKADGYGKDYETELYKFAIVM